MTEEVDFEAWAKCLCTLLDAIELALRDENPERALNLTMGRHEIARANGLDVVFAGEGSGRMQ